MVNKRNSLPFGLFEKPNTPLITWAVCLLAGKMIAHTSLHDTVLHRLLELVSFGALFTWAWLELFQGRNNFRRALGLIVLVAILTSRV